MAKKAKANKEVKPEAKKLPSMGECADQDIADAKGSVGQRQHDTRPETLHRVSNFDSLVGSDFYAISYTAEWKHNVTGDLRRQPISESRTPITLYGSERFSPKVIRTLLKAQAAMKAEKEAEKKD